MFSIPVTDSALFVVKRWYGEEIATMAAFTLGFGQ